MPDPVVEQIIKAAEALIEPVAAAHKVKKLERNRQKDIIKFPALVIYDGDQSSTGENTFEANYRVDIVIQGVLKLSAEENVGARVNLFYADVLKAMLAEPRTLGGLAIDIKEQELSREFNDSGAQVMGEFFLTLQIDFATRPGDPFTIGP